MKTFVFQHIAFPSTLGARLDSLGQSLFCRKRLTTAQEKGSAKLGRGLALKRHLFCCSMSVRPGAHFVLGPNLLVGGLDSLPGFQPVA